ncbi:hypothetical protein [Dactylosporangium darangshiense]|uniref:DUF5753 domain-containing protein n=1 Tax=Dactylosporangium darangshiense TaxID=579108 RepID=A0ABP8DJ54_9ACTN
MFYRSRDLVVTAEHFEVLRPAYVQYRIDFLEGVYVLEHPRAGRTRAAQEIRAQYGLHDVRLFHSSDPRIFGQVRRALIRALEWREQQRRYATSG